MKRKKNWNLASIKAKFAGHDGAGNGQEAPLVPQNDGERDALTRDLSLGGAVLLGLGAKQVLLPALALSHPLLLAVTLPATVVTGRRYLRSLWDTGTGKAPLNTDTLAGAATVAAVVSGGSATALAGVGVLNLGKYLTQKRAISLPVPEQEDEEVTSSSPSPPLPSWPHAFTHYAAPASLALGGLIFAPHFISLIPSVGTSLAVTNELIAFLRTTPYAPWLYMGAQAARPMLLPASLLTIAGGLLFGPYWGVLYAVAGSSASAMFGYVIGHYLGERVTVREGASQEVVQRYAEGMRQNPFESVLTMRMLFLPYDLVNYLAGALQIEWQPFLLASVLGSLPGTISFVLLGASIEGNLITGIPTLNPATLAASGVIFVSSLALSRYLKDDTDTLTSQAALPSGPPSEEEEQSMTGELGLA
ncbi:MAG: TVP38/TMEM64 family protein [Ardenticatenaceae bacterium]